MRCLECGKINANQKSLCDECGDRLEQMFENGEFDEFSIEDFIEIPLR